MLIAVTGANGFVGNLLCRQLLADGHRVRGVVRSSDMRLDRTENIDVRAIRSIDAPGECPGILEDVDVVVHLAAKVHDMAGVRNDNAIDEYRFINAKCTELWANMAAEKGVKRFVFLSTIKVNGEKTEDRAFDETDESAPRDAYGISKWEAERAIEKIGLSTSMEYVVIRLPLVYGPGVKANFLRLLKIIHKGFPLPFGSINNRRSLLYVGNLIDAIKCCVVDKRAAGHVFMVSDGIPVSTVHLVKTIANALGQRPKLLPVPGIILKLMGKLIGSSGEIQRIMDSLELNDNKIRSTLQWQPPYTFEEGIKLTTDWFKGYEKASCKIV